MEFVASNDNQTPQELADELMRLAQWADQNFSMINELPSGTIKTTRIYEFIGNLKEIKSKFMVVNEVQYPSISFETLGVSVSHDIIRAQSYFSSFSAHIDQLIYLEEQGGSVDYLAWFAELAKSHVSNPEYQRDERKKFLEHIQRREAGDRGSISC